MLAPIDCSSRAERTSGHSKSREHSSQLFSVDLEPTPTIAANSQLAVPSSITCVVVVAFVLLFLAGFLSRAYPVSHNGELDARRRYSALEIENRLHVAIAKRIQALARDLPLEQCLGAGDLGLPYAHVWSRESNTHFINPIFTADTSNGTVRLHEPQYACAHKKGQPRVILRRKRVTRFKSGNLTAMNFRDGVETYSSTQICDFDAICIQHYLTLPIPPNCKSEL